MAWIAVYLITAGQLTNELWSRGRHVTPGYAAYHQMLEQLGLPFHHGQAAQTPAIAWAKGAAWTLLPSPITVVSAATVQPFSPETTWYVLVAGASGFAVALLLAPGVRSSRARLPLGWRPDPPDPPPLRAV